jgi:hypothetical protein
VIGNFFWGAYQDANHTVMLGTVNGISYTNREWVLYKTHSLSDKIPSLLQKNWISSFVEDTSSWLVGTHSSGLFRYQPLTNQVEKLTKDFQVWDFKKHNDEVFMVGNDGLLQYNLKTKIEKTIHLPSKVSSLSNVLYGVDAENDTTLWIVGNTRYVARYHLKTRTFEVLDLLENHSDKSTNQLGTQLLIDQRKDIWVFTGFHGIFKFSKAKQQFFPIANTDSVQFETLRTRPSFDQQNVFWLPSKGKGLYRYNPADGRFVLWSKAEGLGSNLSTSSVADNHGKIWTCAFHKISIFDVKSEFFQSFYISASEDNNDYISKLFKLKNGHIISSIKGNLVEFMPERFQRIRVNEKPLINQVQIAGHQTIYASGMEDVSLAVGQNNPTITFGYLPMSVNNTPYQFAYYLEGFDQHWRVETTNCFANYADLPGGNYTFKVKAIYGNFESPIAQLRLHVDAPFYKTSWAKVLAALLVISLALAFARYRTNQRQKIHHLLLQSTRLEKDKTEIQYQNLINHLNPHFLFNSLASLNSLIITEPKQASKFLQKLSAIYRYILQSKDKEVVSLEHELNFVKNYVELQQSRFEDGLYIDIQIPDDFLSAEIVPVTMQNLFENAIKHNSISDDSPLRITVLIDDEYLIIKNNLQRKAFVETSNQQGLDSLKKLYSYLSSKPFLTSETSDEFVVKIPLL